jgi:hypothetical protein
MHLEYFCHAQEMQCCEPIAFRSLRSYTSKVNLYIYISWCSPVVGHKSAYSTSHSQQWCKIILGAIVIPPSCFLISSSLSLLYLSISLPNLACQRRMQNFSTMEVSMCRAQNFSYSYIRNNLVRSLSWRKQTNQGGPFDFTPNLICLRQSADRPY